jgi:SHS2 domain-containing protein
MSSWRHVEHTADLAIELRAPTEEELLQLGATALISMLVEGEPAPGEERRDLHVDALDPEDRLVQWLNEVMLVATVDGFVASSCRVTLNGTGLDALLTGRSEAWQAIEQELKSVTYHDLVLRTDDEGWFARIVIDV